MILVNFLNIIIIVHLAQPLAPVMQTTLHHHDLRDHKSCTRG